VHRVERAIAALARRQGGHVTRGQLAALGLERHEIDYRLKRGTLILVFAGVYAVGHLPTNPIDRAYGALLACGSGAALSHRSAGSLWGIWKDWRFALEVVTAADRRRQGVIVHRSASLTPADFRTERGLRVTSPARTLLDVAPRLPERRLVRATNELRLADRLTLGQLRDVCDRFPRSAGAAMLRSVLDRSQTEPTRSDLEDDFPPFAAAHALPRYVMNRHICGYRVDVFFPAERLVLEIDSWKFHQSREAFERDRRQDADILEYEGIPTVRTTWTRLSREAAREAARLALILERRRGELDSAA